MAFGARLTRGRGARGFAVAWPLVLCLWLSGCAGASPGDGHHQRVTLGGRVFHLELALAPRARFQGLSDRAAIAPDGGMLFVFPRPLIARFVMRRCLVPIDIIFLDPGGRVTRTYHMAVEPYDTPEAKLKTYSSVYPAQFAIELKGGTLKSLGIQRGQRIDLPRQSLKRRAR